MKNRRLKIFSSRLRMASLMTIFFGSSGVMAADYSVSLAAPAMFGDTGAPINLYRINKRTFELVQSYVLPEYDWTGQLSRPLTIVMNPAHDFVYVAYSGTSVPNVVGFKVTAAGLVKEWEHTLSTGSPVLAGTTLIAQDGYLIENTRPFDLWVRVLTQSGEELLMDNGSTGHNLVSGHIDPHGKFYYSCRYVTSPQVYPNGAANTVVVYDLGGGYVAGSTPILTSTDPSFVRSICD